MRDCQSWQYARHTKPPHRRKVWQVLELI